MPQSPAKESFAHAGARLSFQKRVEQDAKAIQSPPSPSRTAPLVLKLKASNQDNATQIYPVQTRIASENKPLDTPNRPASSSGALLAAAAAAKNSKRRAQSPPRPPGRTNLEKDSEAAKQPDPQDSISRPSEKIKRSYVAAAKASLHRSNSSSAVFDDTKANKLDSRRFLLDPPPSMSFTTPASSSPSSSASSLRTLDSNSHFATAAAKLSSTLSSRDETPMTAKINSQVSDVSAQAARSIAKRRPPAIPVPELPKESKFGIILTRPVSPAPLHREHSSGRSTPQNDVRSIYRLPESASSEPVLCTTTLDPFRLPSKVHPASPFVPLAWRPKLSERDASEVSSLADFGAATAMSSRSSSAISLPATSNVEIPESANQVASTNRRRHVHLKTTMRKEPRTEREKHHNHPGPQAITEQERKRYEGVWASNHHRDLPTSAEYIDNFVVREIWSRSQLSAEILGHIW